MQLNGEWKTLQFALLRTGYKKGFNHLIHGTLTNRTYNPLILESYLDMIQKMETNSTHEQN